MKRLFCVVDRVTGKPVPESDRENKMDAKSLRDELNEADGSETRYHVSPGPDHKYYAK